jgi:UDP-GlcNAc:undecaprenyl-phosphate/decaprenyl-phosphate GlcNAc-1-phosphate transferase
MFDNQYLFITLAGFFICMLLFTVMMNTILLKFSTNLGTRDKNITIVRWSSVSKPALGGIAFFIAFMMSIAYYSIFFNQQEIFLNKPFIGLVFACTAGFLIGLADDAYNTNPYLKLLGQIICGLTLVLTGTTINTFENELINQILTVLWVIGIMNSINMLDNMDAITTVTSIGIITIALLFLATNNLIDYFDFLLMFGVLAALIGFLFHNWHPSKMYMGDTGSQFLGIFLAFIGIKYFWNAPFPTSDFAIPQKLILVATAFVLPISDTTTVTINRLLRKQSPFVGGKDHTTHYLSYLGMSDSQIGFLFLGINVFSAVLCILIFNFIPEWKTTYTILFGSYILLVFSGLYFTTKSKFFRKLLKR